MHINTIEQFQALLKTRSPFPEIVVETGTFRGNSARLLSPAVRVWHTIDINPKFTEFAKKRCAAAGRKNIVFWTGDSRTVLAEVLALVNEPCLIFLDAHFGNVRRKTDPSEPDLVHGPIGSDFPLMTELKVVSSRPYADLVFVDDTVQFGKDFSYLRPKNRMGRYKDKSPQWESMTLELVERTLGRVIEYKECFKGAAYWRSPL